MLDAHLLDLISGHFIHDTLCFPSEWNVVAISQHPAPVPMRARPRSPPLATPSPSRKWPPSCHNALPSRSVPVQGQENFAHVLMVRGDGRVTKRYVIIGMPLDRPFVPDQCSSGHHPCPVLGLLTAVPLAHTSLASATGSTTADTMVATQPLQCIVPLSFVFPFPFPSPFGSDTASSGSGTPVRKRL